MRFIFCHEISAQNLNGQRIGFRLWKSLWGFGVFSRLWPVWSYLEQAVQGSFCCCYCFIIITLTQGLCYSTSLCFSGPLATQTTCGDGVPRATPFFCPCYGWRLPCPPPPLPSSCPLALSGFTICLVRSPWPKKGCPWGRQGSLPPAIRLPTQVPESDFEASYCPFYL